MHQSFVINASSTDKAFLPAGIVPPVRNVIPYCATIMGYLKTLIFHLEQMEN